MIREFLNALATVITLLAFAFVAGAIVGAFFYGLFSIANMAPG
jgi:hypothetical protein